MIALYIIGGILLLIIILLLCPIVLSVKYVNDCLTVRLCGFRLVPPKDKPKKEKKKKKENTEQDIKEQIKPKKKSKINFNQIKTLVTSATPAVKRVFKGMKIRRFRFVYVCAGEDAAKTAIQYGKICAAVSSVLPLVQNIFDIKFDKIDVRLDFSVNKPYNEVKFKAKLRVYVLIAAAIIFLKNYLKTSKSSEVNQKSKEK
jgi:Protein of unknown function (DUF2953).